MWTKVISSGIITNNILCLPELLVLATNIHLLCLFHLDVFQVKCADRSRYGSVLCWGFVTCKPGFVWFFCALDTYNKLIFLFLFFMKLP